MSTAWRSVPSRTICPANVVDVRASTPTPGRHVRAAGAILIALLAIAAIVTFQLREGDDMAAIDPSAQADKPKNAADSRVEPHPTGVRSSVPRTTSTQPSAEPSLRDRFVRASDYHEFARSVLDAARAGNSEAQFLLFQTLDFCEMGYRFYFDRRNRRRTLDEALQWASTRTPSADLEEVRDVYDKCHLLMEKEARNPFGAADDWLAAATEAGHPVAQAKSAGKLLLEASFLEGKAEFGLYGDRKSVV